MAATNARRDESNVTRHTRSVGTARALGSCSSVHGQLATDRNKNTHRPIRYGRRWWLPWNCIQGSSRGWGAFRFLGLGESLCWKEDVMTKARMQLVSPSVSGPLRVPEPLSGPWASALVGKRPPKGVRGREYPLSLKTMISILSHKKSPIDSSQDFNFQNALRSNVYHRTTLF